MRMTRYLGLLMMLMLALRASAQGGFNPSNPPEPLVQYRVVVGSTPDGVAYTSGSGKYTPGTTVSIRTSARNSNFSFQHWLKDGEVFTTDMNFSYTMESGNVTFTAVWLFTPNSPSEPMAKNEYRLYLEEDIAGAGSFNRSSGAKAEAGSNVYLRAYNNQGFVFEGWYEGETLVNSNASFYYNMPAHNTTLTAHYRYDPSNPADPQSNQTDIDNRLIGDVNNDGVITSADAVCIINYVVRKENAVFIEENADANSDGVITSADAVCIINQVVRKDDGNEPANPD